MILLIGKHQFRAEFEGVNTFSAATMSVDGDTSDSKSVAKDTNALEALMGNAEQLLHALESLELKDSGWVMRISSS